MTTGLVVRVVTVMTVRVVPVVMMTGRAGPSVMMTGVLVVRAVTRGIVRVVPVVMMTVRRAGRSVTMTVHPGRSASRVPRLSVASAR
ncbi:MAG: hypothetical protein RL573_1222, partial [Actinomycetota bacterium]